LRGASARQSRSSAARPTGDAGTGRDTLRWALYEAAGSATRPTSPDHADYLRRRARMSHTRATPTIARKLARRAYQTLRELGEEAIAPAAHSLIEPYVPYRPVRRPGAAHLSAMTLAAGSPWFGGHRPAANAQQGTSGRRRFRRGRASWARRAAACSRIPWGVP